jgi:hypothetical protein
MVKSDLGREFKTNFLMTFAVNAFSMLVMKTTEGGARSLVLASAITPDEHGRHYTNYQSDVDYKE